MVHRYLTPGAILDSTNQWLADQTLADDVHLILGTTGGSRVLLSSGSISADAEVTNVIEGTSNHQGVAANSLVISNITDDGDIIVLVSDGGNSLEVLNVTAASAGLSMGHGMATVEVKTASGAITLDATTDVIVPAGTGLLVGHTANLTIGSQNPEMQIVGAGIADSVLAMAHFGADANRPVSIYAALSRGASKGSHTSGIVEDDDQIFAITAYGSNGTHFNYAAASYRIEVDGDPGASADMPGRHVWLNCPDGSGSLAETMRLDNAGDLTFNQASVISTSTGDLDLTSAGNMDITVQGGAAASLKISDGTTSILYPDWRTNVGTVAWMSWHKGATGFASHADLTPWFFRLISGTITLTGTTPVTAMNGLMLEIGAQTVTDTSTVTVTKASALYIKNVVAGGEVTITNNYAIDTEAGAFLTAAGVWTDNPSTLAKKNDVLDISPASLRGAIRTIHPRQWIYKDEWNDAGQQRYGIVAEELPGFLKPLGSTQNDVVQPSIMAGFALAGVHHLEDRITQLEAQVAALS